MVQEIHLVGRLDQDVKVSSISPRRLSSILLPGPESKSHSGAFLGWN